MRRMGDILLHFMVEGQKSDHISRKLEAEMIMSTIFVVFILTLRIDPIINTMNRHAKIFLAACIWSLPYASMAQNKMEEVRLSMNENAFGQAKGVKEAIIQALDSINRYPTAGAEFIRDIAHREGVDPEQIIPGEILPLLGVYLGLKGGAGSEFIYTVPGYPALVNGAAKVGGKVVSVPLNERLENDLPAIAAKINTKTQAVFLVNPHNPSGTVIEDTTFRHFVHEIAKKVLVIVDEAYLEFADHFEDRTVVKNIWEGDNVIVFRTFAKTYGLAGLSLGYAVASKKVAAYLKEQGLGDPHELNSLSLAAAKVALKDQEFIRQVHTQVSAEREKWHTLLDSLHLERTQSQGNFVYFNTKRPYDEVAAHLRKQGIVIGRVFEPYDTWVRITIGLPDENDQARQAIRNLISTSTN